jgi:predicted glycosyltransferase
MKKILFYCQSSLGIGHTIRSLRITEGLGEAFEVHFLHGGELIPDLKPPAGVRVIPLPAISTDAEFKELQTSAPGVSLEEAFAQRRDIMLDAYRRIEPDIVLVELYPFGRGRFGQELKPLLKLAKKEGVQVVCSLRDILVGRKDQDAYETKVVERMNRFFDLLLVHSDQGFQDLRDSFSRLDEIEAPIRYTGYVCPALKTAAKSGEKTIIASIGGGRFGHELAEAVVRTAPLLAGRIPHQIQLYTGPFCPDEVAQRLHDLAAGVANISVARFTPDLHQRLLDADLSISMGGYNTTMNVLATGVRAMIMACRNNGGMDQAERVDKLAGMGVIKSIHPDELKPERFAGTIVDYLQEHPTSAMIDLDGVSVTTEALLELVDNTEIEKYRAGATV